MIKNMIRAVILVSVFINVSPFAAVTVSPGIIGGTDWYSARNWSSGGITSSYINKFSLGGFANFRISSDFSVRAAITYSGRGYGSIDTTSNNPPAEYLVDKARLNYIAFPVDFKLGTDVAYFLGGINFGFLANATDHQTGLQPDNGGIARPIDSNVNTQSKYNRSDIGVELGIGLNVPTPYVTPFIEFTGYAGLKNIFKNSSLSASNAGYEIRGGVMLNVINWHR